MKCKKVEYLLPAYIMGDLNELSEDPDLYSKIEAHLKKCPKCTRDYESYKQTLGFVEENKDLFAQVFNEIDRERAAESQAAKSKTVRLFVRIGAVAACFLIGVSLLIILFNNLKSQIPQENSTSQHVSSAIVPAVKIESISESGNLLIAGGQKVNTSNQLKTLLINEKHHLIMDENTTLTIKPLVSNELIGCVVNLSSGRIYTHVEHDGNPFVVETTHGKAIITGTTFDIEANESKMKLIVSEGSVKFTSQGESVYVSAGYTSEILAMSAPIPPSLCDIKQLTAWATGYELKTALAKMESMDNSVDLSELWITAGSGPVKLEEIDYNKWIEDKRDWFEREFPKIFQLKEALSKENIEADYPELLYTSGNLWQFVYPQVSNYQMIQVSSESLLQTSSKFGFDKDWLQKNIPSLKSLADMSDNTHTDVSASDQWISDFENARKSQKPIDAQTLFSSLHAVTYLVNTRTLAWLYITNENIGFTANEKAEILELLQSEVNAAIELNEHIIRLFAASENLSCGDFNTLVENVIDSVTEIMGIEGKITEYEINK